MAPVMVKAQQIDNYLSYKSINSDQYFRLNYENDFFSATDIYYTQGISIEIVNTGFKKYFLYKLLLHPAGNYSRQGIALEHNGYTPTSIGSDTILKNDRPFAACILLKAFQISIDPVKSKRTSSVLSAGIIGQAALGAEMQTGIHRLLNNVRPHGWPNQIHNDAILNYQIDYEKQVYNYGKISSIDLDAVAKAGTLNDKAGMGSTIIAGYFDDPFKNRPASKKHFRIYAYEHFLINLVGYDATMQGGLFDKNSPYTIPASNIDRVVFENRFGFVVVYRNIYLEYFQSYLSQEFKTGTYHVWGGIQIAFSIN
jgi:hypothetical protein